MSPSAAIQTQGTLVQLGSTASPAVYTTIGEVVSFGGPTGTAAEINVTHLQSVAKEYLMGLPDEGQFTMEVNYVPSDVQQKALITAREQRVKRKFKITFTDPTPGPTAMTFEAFVLGFEHRAAADDAHRVTITLRITGGLTRTP